MKDLLPAPYEDRVMIPDGTPPLRTVVVHPVVKSEYEQRLAVVQARRRREAFEKRDKTRRVTKKLRPIGPAPVATFETILEVTCSTLGVDRADVMGSRRKLASLAREVVAYLSRSLGAMTFPAIADAMDRSHSSVFDACHRVSSRMNLVVGQFYTGDVPGRCDSMTYAGVVEELERKIANAGGAS